MASVRGPISSTAAAFLLTVACGPTSPDADAGIRDAVVDAPAIPLCERAADCEAPGAECVDVRCAPSDPAADGRGCVVTPRCVAGEICEAGRCVPECGSPDRDRDGDPSIACGGADCDDDDSGRSSLRVEMCDEAGIDEDCDPTTIAGESDGDADGDDLIDHRCFNVRDDGSENRGPDCDETVAGTGLGSVDHCGACGDACQFACEAGSCDDPVQLAAGGASTCAVTESGALWCWGRGVDGELGNGSADSSTVPRQAPLSFAPIDIDGSQSCFVAASADGDVYAWGGCRGARQLEPLNLSFWFSGPAARVGSSSGHVCAVLRDGRVQCFGDNDRGQLGIGSTGPSGSGTVTGLTAGWISAASEHTCASTVAGGISCWGWELYAELGNGLPPTEEHASPVMVVATPASEVTSLSVGRLHSCAAFDSGEVRCWGRNFNNELGLDNPLQSCGAAFPSECAHEARVVAVTAVEAVEVGFEHSCALTRDGDVSCWGSNEFGQLGDPITTGSRAAPSRVSGIVGATQVTAGDSHTCVIAGPRIQCWGRNEHGQLGDGTRLDRVAPVLVAQPE